MGCILLGTGVEKGTGSGLDELMVVCVCVCVCVCVVVEGVCGEKQHTHKTMSTFLALYC